MNEKIQILDLQIDNLTAKDAVKHVVSYMETEPVSVVEMVTMNTLEKFRQDTITREMFESFDMALAGDRGILEAAGETDERRLKEVEDLLFVKMVMRFLHKNGVRVSLIAKDNVDLKKLELYMQEDYFNIQITGKASLEENGTSDDMILNLLNGVEAECILSTLPSPEEEGFIFRNKSLVNARVWLGIGNLLKELKEDKTRWQKIKDFIKRQILKKRIAKKGENA